MLQVVLAISLVTCIVVRLWVYQDASPLIYDRGFGGTGFVKMMNPARSA